MIVANATGCSSIYGANLPTTPWTVNAAGAVRHGTTRCSRTTRSSGSACASRSTPRPITPAAAARAPPLGDRRRTSSRALGRARTPKARSCSSGTGSTASARRSPCRRSACLRGPTPAGARRGSRSQGRLDHRRRRLGLRHRFGGVDQVLSSVATSTSSSSTRRSTRTPAGRRRRRPRAGPWRSSRPPARPPPRRISGPSRARTATSTSPRSRWARTTSRRRRRCSRPMPGRVRRSSSPTAPASPTGST